MHEENPLPIIQFDPHSGLATPVELQGRLQINNADIYNDADLCVDQYFDFSHPDLADLVPGGYTPGTLCTISTPIARMLIDANRYPDDHPNGNPSNPDGIVKRQTSYGKAIYTEPLTSTLRAQLIERYYNDFHRRAEAALARYGTQARLLLDCHNMAQHGPDAYPDAGQARPLLCISNVGDPLGNPNPDVGQTSCSADLLKKTVMIATELFGDMTLMNPQPGFRPPIALMNQPFWGGYILRRYSRIGDPQITTPAIMIEVNRGLYVGDQNADSPLPSPDEERIAKVRRRLYQLIIEVLETLERN